MSSGLQDDITIIKEVAIGTSRGLRQLTQQLGGKRGSARGSRFIKSVHEHVRQKMGLVAKGAVDPAMTNVPEWAGNLAPDGVVSGGAEFLLSMKTAYSEIAARSLRLSLDGIADRSIPYSGDPFVARIIAEGEPVPVHKLNFKNAPMDPFKLAGGTVLTRELAKSSNAEAVLERELTYSLSRGLDCAFLGDPATYPTSLLAHAIQVTPSATGDPNEDAIADLGNLIGALTKPSGNIVYVCVSSRAAKISMRFPALTNPVVAVSDVLDEPDGVIAVDCGHLATALGDDVYLNTTQNAAVEMDTTPTGDVVAGGKEVLSMYQSDLIGIMALVAAAWAVAPESVSIVRGVTW